MVIATLTILEVADLITFTDTLLYFDNGFLKKKSNKMNKTIYV